MSKTLDQLIAQRSVAPFEWGHFDCVMFAADAVWTQTGRDLADGYRRSYSTAAGAAVLLHRLGGVRALGSLAGPAITPTLARKGDVGVLRHDGREMLAVCVGELWLCPAAERGLAAYPLSAAVAAWRVIDA